MKLSKYDLLKLKNHASQTLADMPNQLHWDLNKELSQSERIALAWINAINIVCKTDIEVDCKEEVRYE